MSFAEDALVGLGRILAKLKGESVLFIGTQSSNLYTKKISNQSMMI